MKPLKKTAIFNTPCVRQNLNSRRVIRKNGEGRDGKGKNNLGCPIDGHPDAIRIFDGYFADKIDSPCQSPGKFSLFPNMTGIPAGEVDLTSQVNEYIVISILTKNSINNGYTAHPRHHYMYVCIESKSTYISTNYISPSNCRK